MRKITARTCQYFGHRMTLESAAEIAAAVLENSAPPARRVITAFFSHIVMTKGISDDAALIGAVEMFTGCANLVEDANG